jgi:hypothetical protein
MAEVAQQGNEGRKDRVLDYEYNDRRLGMKLGFAALLVLAAVGLVVIWLGQTAVGTGVLGASLLTGVVGAFIKGRSTNGGSNETPAAKK